MIEAALEILAERGFDGLTMEAVAARAGVAKTTVYRRWPSRADLVVGVAETLTAPVRPPKTGSLETDLVALLGDVIGVLNTRTGRRVIPRALADARERDELADVLRPFWAGRRRLTIDLLRAGVERGELRSDLDLEAAADAFYGPVYYRYLVTGAELNPAVARAIVARALGGMRARP